MTTAQEVIKAAKSGDVERLSALVQEDISLLDARDKDGSTPLHCAAWKGHYEVASALIDFGADVNAQSTNEHYGGTPLHAAAHGSHKDIAELLIAHGADMDALSGNGRTPLQETEFHKATAVAKLLKQRGAAGS